MIIDTSALVAILLDESDADIFARCLETANRVRISAGSYVEIGAVVGRARNPNADRRLDGLLQEARITIEPVTEEQARVARSAYRDFGRGSGHPAHLNFGDCFAYALAKAFREPLLFKGNDFIHTDITPALRR
jgi:ribonuclease VapC